MMTVTATDIQNNFGKYLHAVQTGDEIFILKILKHLQKFGNTVKSTK